MSIQPGSLMLLKVLNGDSFDTIGGLKTTRMVLNNQTIDITNKLSGNWRELLSGAVRSISITGGGIFTDSSSELKIRNLSFSGAKEKFQMCFGSGEIFEGYFIISSYERTGNYDDEETYTITLESASNVEIKNHA
ncbi:MAG: phage major tail protein, TP901-1 family [Alphaproteobacteria bacterium]|nr:phage major tail protein, TP901-1 family [Alphaproteobacteria bacterium]